MSEKRRLYERHAKRHVRFGSRRYCLLCGRTRDFSYNQALGHSQCSVCHNTISRHRSRPLRTKRPLVR